MPFEPTVPLTLTGTISPSIVTDPDAPPSTIIKTTDNFTVSVNWNISGTVVSLLGGTFHVRACFDRLGGAPEVIFGPVDVPVSAGTGNSLSKNFTANIPVAAGSLAEGAYDMVVLLTYSNLGVPGNIAGYSDEKVIQIYTPNPLMP